MILIMLLCAGILLALCFPETLIGQAAKRVFVDKPADWLNALTLRRVLMGVVLGLIFMAVLSVFPAEFALIAAGDITAYVEVMAAIIMMASRVPLKRIAGQSAKRIQVLGQTLRKPAQFTRSKHRAIRPLSRNDSEDSEPDWAFA